MMKRWKLSDVQAEAIFNMRLRALRKLEEIVIREEHSALSKEQKELKLLMKDEQRRWQVIGEQVRDIKARFGDKTPLGKRRTEIGDVPSAVVIPLEAVRSEEHTSELQSLMRISYAVFCLKKKKYINNK